MDEGKEFITAKKFKEAIDVFTKALDFDYNNLEVLFYRGISLLDFGKPQDAIKDLKRILSIKPDYKKLVYLVLSIAYKRLDKKEAALQTLSEGVYFFPTFSDVYLARAHIYLYMKQYQNALNDFRSFNKYASNKTELGTITEDLWNLWVYFSPNAQTAGLIGEGDALKKLGKFDKATECYSKIVEDETIRQESRTLHSTAVERRALNYFHCRSFSKALVDFETISNLP